MKATNDLGKKKWKGLTKKFDTLSFSFENLGLTVKGPGGLELEVLKGVTGKIEACQLVAVMGPSGNIDPNLCRLTPYNSFLTAYLL